MACGHNANLRDNDIMESFVCRVERRAVARSRWRCASIVISALATCCLAAAHRARAQQPMPAMNMSDSTPDMMMTGPLGISTDRQGSGTSWVPEAVLMPFRHALLGKWDIMSHWNAFGQYDAQRGPRGDT